MASIKDSEPLPSENIEKKKQSQTLLSRSISSVAIKNPNEYNPEVSPSHLNSKLKKSITLAFDSGNLNSMTSRNQKLKKLSTMASQESFETISPTMSKFFNQSLAESESKISAIRTSSFSKNEEKIFENLQTMNSSRTLRWHKSSEPNFGRSLKCGEASLKDGCTNSVKIGNQIGWNKNIFKKSRESELKIGPENKKGKAFLNNHRKRLFSGITERELLTSRNRRSQFGLAMYSMNAFPVYTALYSPI